MGGTWTERDITYAASSSATGSRGGDPVSEEFYIVVMGSRSRTRCSSMPS